MDIFVRNKNFVLLGILDVFESLIWKDRYQGFGDFEIYTNFSSETFALMQPTYYLNIDGSENTMIIESVEIKTNVETGNKLIIKGRSLVSILDRRVVFQSQVYKDVTLQAIVLDLIYKNAINAPGQPFRNIPGVVNSVSTDPLVTAPIYSADYYSENVYDTILYLCQHENLGFKMIRDATNQFVFSLYAGKDRSYSQSTNPPVVFSPNFDNLISSDYTYTNQFAKNVALIFGDYNNVPRPAVDWYGPDDPYDPTISYLNRREVYVDAGDLSMTDPGTGLPVDTDVYNKAMYNRAKENLAVNRVIITFDAEANTTYGYKYGTDFFLGDILQIADMFGNKERVRITEVAICENSSGIFTYPTFEKI